MMTENEVLEKLASYKDAIIRIKNERDSAKQKAEELQLKIDSQNETYMQDSKEAWEKADHWEKSYNDLKEKSYHTIKHLVEDNIEVKEKEIEELKKNTESSQALLKDRDYLFSLVQANYNMEILDAGTSEYIRNLKDSLSASETKYEELLEKSATQKLELDRLKQSAEKDRQLEEASKNEFIEKVEKLIEEAAEALMD